MRLLNPSVGRTLLFTGRMASSAAKDGISHQADGPLYRIFLDRADRFNAFHIPMFNELAAALKHADADAATKITVLTGKGKFFTAGNDLNNVGKAKTVEEMNSIADELCQAVDNVFRAFIDHEKPLVVLANGPAYGIGTTALPLCDVAFAADTAQELLLFNRVITAQEALDWGLVSRVFPSADFEAQTEKILQQYAKLPQGALRGNKVMVRALEKSKLLEVHNTELTELRKRFVSPESIAATKKFLESRQKKK